MVDGISDNLAVSAIHVNGNNIYVGTGELVAFEPTMNSLVSQVQWNPDSTTLYQHGVFQYAGMVGEGVFVSNDGGSTWSLFYDGIVQYFQAAPNGDIFFRDAID